MARSWLIRHPRTYSASPLPQKEDHILQLSPQNSKTRFSTLSARYSIHLSHSRPLVVSVLCRILVCCSCCSLGRPGTFFQGTFDTISLIQPFLSLYRGSLLCVPQHFVGTFPLVSIPVSFASMIFHNISWEPQGQDSVGTCLLSSHRAFPTEGY